MRAAASLAAGVAAVIALAATLESGLTHSLGLLDRERARFAPMSHDERERAFGQLIPIGMETFDFYRSGVREDDRFYVQVADEPFGIASQAVVVQSVARLYLAPAVQVETPEEATVVISFDSDPGLLPLRYSEQMRAGLHLFFVSRVAR